MFPTGFCCTSWAPSSRSHSQTQAVRSQVVPSNHSIILALHRGLASPPVHAESHSQPHGTAVSRSRIHQPSPFYEGLAEMQRMLAVHVHGLTAVAPQFHSTCRILKSCSAISSLPILQPISSEFSSGGQGLLEVLDRLGLTVRLRQMKRISF